jgi:hypothetical protein
MSAAEGERRPARISPEAWAALKRQEHVAKAIFLAEHPGAEWSAGRARAIWFIRAEAAIAALAALDVDDQPDTGSASVERSGTNTKELF